MTALRATTTDPAAAPETESKEKRKVRPKIGGEDILACRLTNVPVTITSPRVGTVLVTVRGFKMYRDLSRHRGDIDIDERYTEIICDLFTAFSLAGRIRKDDGWALDVSGNTILLDREEKLVFIVDCARRLLLAVYDKAQSNPQ